MSTPPRGLKARVLRAGAWTMLGHGAGQALRLGGNLVMTRLLVPEMFGVMAIATTVNIVLGMLSDIGVRQNIVQSRRGDDPLFLDTAWVVQISRSVLLWVAAALLAAGLHLANRAGLVPSTSVYASAELPWVIALTSLSIVITGFQSTKMATAQRKLNQARAIRIALYSQAVALAVMIAVAFAQRSIWALVAGALVATLVSTVLSHAWMAGHRNRLRVDKTALAELLRFGKWIFLSSGLYVLTVSGDRLILGAFLEAHALGMYAIASLLVGAVAGTLNKFYAFVSLPALSETARNAPARLREVYGRLNLPPDLLLVFTAGCLFASGQGVIDLLYDPRYADAGAMVQVLSLSLLAVRYEVARQAYLALGLPQYGTAMSVVRFLALYSLVPLLYAGWGVAAAIWGVALHALAAVPLVYAFNAKLGLNDFRREGMALCAFPVGWGAGWLLGRLS